MAQAAGAPLPSLLRQALGPLISFPSDNATLLTVAKVIVALAVVGIIFTVLDRLAGRISRTAGAPKGMANSVRQWIAVIMGLVAVASVAGLTGFSSEFTTLTISGIAGLALSLALQTTLSNVIAGVLMLHDGVLRAGDMVEFGSVKGEVVKLSLRTTWIRTADGAISVVGNSNLSAGPIINRTAKERLERKIQP
jgi:small conductance mechanosensitive channel